MKSVIKMLKYLFDVTITQISIIPDPWLTGRSRFVLHPLMGSQFQVFQIFRRF